MSGRRREDAPSYGEDPGQRSDGTRGSLLRATPGLARISAAAAWRSSGWAVRESARAYSRLVRRAVSGQSPAEVLQETRADLRDYARRMLGILGEDREPAGGSDPVGDANRRGFNATTSALRERGEELLRRSADVHFEEDAHPAYTRILSELAPDEGRILRLLAIDGPQPAVDVRTRRPLGIGSELVAPGLTMIGAGAGCRHTDRVNSYLHNLFRLGLIWFSREAIRDTLRYQVLEAQPDVVAAMQKAGRASTVRRSIHLTPFGEDFCKMCLPLDAAGLEALPGEGGAGSDRAAAADEEGAEQHWATPSRRPPE
jgi:abortive infection alpha-like protein